MLKADSMLWARPNGPCKAYQPVFGVSRIKMERPARSQKEEQSPDLTSKNNAVDSVEVVEMDFGLVNAA